jgi:hypothetical protein
MARPALRPPRISLALGLLGLAAACKDDPPPQTDGTGTSTGAGASSTGIDPSATSNLTTAPVTTADPDDTTYGPGCGPDPCPEMCGPDCPSTATCLASVWMCECDCPSTGTTGGEACDTLGADLDAWVEPSKSPAVDCGSPGPDDDVFAWQTLHDCSIIQAMGSGLRGTWTLADGADPFEYGVGGRVGAVYELAWYERSTTTLVQYSCSAIVATPDCDVDVGMPCLTCEDQTEVAVLCDEGIGSGSSGSAGSSSG